jgi:hypothetical protein
MPSDIIYYLTFYLIIPVAYLLVLGPVETLLHELGHAIVNRAQTHQPVHIYLGFIPPQEQLGDSTLRPRRTWVVTLRGITLYLQPFSGPIGYTHWEVEAPDPLWTLLTGPLVSLLLGIVFSIITILSRSHTHTFSILYYVWQVAAICAFAQFLLTLLPLRYPSWFGPYAGMYSDGYQLLQFLRHRRTAQVQYNTTPSGSGMMSSFVDPNDITEVSEIHDLEM